ncbi:hypothetical protein WKI68_03840 [Streptomyces sp. MS1.HAVA.3]|uniref:Uncharacterized protein n=1 Tax=Streptomyces caledonius TaxID=3134107 RepID=A0ABU8U0H5_9ACTN
MALLLTIDSSEWHADSESWRPAQDADASRHGSSSPTGVAVGNFGKLNVFTCPHDPAHPHGISVQ